MCATTCTNRLLFPACTPKSYQCSARMPSGPGSLSRGSLRSVVRTSSATSDKKRFATNAWAGAAGSGCAGQRLLISWTICSVTGTGGAFLAAARARLRSPDRASDSLVSLWEDDPKEELKYARGNHCWAACPVSAPDRVEQHACGLGVRFEQSVPPTPLYCHVATASQTQTTGTYRQLQTRNRPKCANPCKTRGRVKGWRIANIWWLARLVNARGPADEREGSGVHQESGDQDQHHHELGAQGTEQPRHPYAEFTSVLNQDSATALYPDQMLNAWSTVQRRRSAHDLQTDLAETIRDALVDAGDLRDTRRAEELIVAAVPQTRNWKEAALPCQQAVKLAHANMVENEGVDAMKEAGSNWETLHLACRTKLQKAIALKIMARCRDRWFVQASERQQQVSLSGSTRNQRGGAGAWSMLQPPRKKPRCRTNPVKRQYAYEWAHHSHHRPPPAKFTKEISQDFAGKRSRCGRASRMAVQKLLETLGTTTTGTGGQDCSRTAETESKRNSSPASVNRKRGCAQTSEESQTWTGTRHTTTLWRPALDNGNTRGS